MLLSRVRIASRGFAARQCAPTRQLSAPRQLLSREARKLARKEQAAEPGVGASKESVYNSALWASLAVAATAIGSSIWLLVADPTKYDAAKKAQESGPGIDSREPHITAQVRISSRIRPK